MSDNPNVAVHLRDDDIGTLARIGNELRQKCKSGGEDCEICAVQQAALKRAIAALEAQGGEWVLVPRDLTEEMFAAHLSSMSVMKKLPPAEKWRALAQSAWAAMLAAAPTPPATAGQE